jgi:hypothetical protein
VGISQPSNDVDCMLITHAIFAPPSSGACQLHVRVFHDVQVVERDVILAIRAVLSVHQRLVRTGHRARFVVHPVPFFLRRDRLFVEVRGYDCCDYDQHDHDCERDEDDLEGVADPTSLS